MPPPEQLMSLVAFPANRDGFRQFLVMSAPPISSPRHFSRLYGKPSMLNSDLQAVSVRAHLPPPAPLASRNARQRDFPLSEANCSVSRKRCHLPAQGSEVSSTSWFPQQATDSASFLGDVGAADQLAGSLLEAI